MLSLRDLHIHGETVPIVLNGVVMGSQMVEYEVQAYTDVRNLEAHRAYVLTVRLRLVISHNYFLDPTAPSSYVDYPIAIDSSIKPVAQNGKLAFRLLDYFPRTVNAVVNTSQATSISSQDSYMSQQTMGSSTSQTNSYDISGSLGFFGDSLTGGISGGWGHSTSSSKYKDHTTGSTRTSGSEAGLSTNMSLKDWGAYAILRESGLYPAWLWGQEFPWNVMQFHNPDANGNVILPDFVKRRLADGGQVFPPSELSLYGVNFLSEARWIVTPEQAAATNETLQLSQGVTIFTASHELQKGHVVATVNDGGTFTNASKILDLPLLALDAIRGEGVENGALIGFSSHEFILAPSLGGNFRIVSGANNLYAAGTGFTIDPGLDGLMQADLSSIASAKFTLYFKIVDPDTDMILYLKHWKTSARGCVISAVINDAVNPVVRHVDSRDASAGSDNLTMIVLRNKDYASEDYYNYLIMGLNRITVTIAPTSDNQGGQAACGYAVRAVAIG